jgi:hypothetical protein
VKISRKRLARIKAKFGSKFIGFRQSDGAMKYISRDRLDGAIADVTNGRDTPAIRALLCAESATDDSRLHQLIQALHRPPYKPVTKLEVIQ